LYGAFAWARRALKHQKRRFPARAVDGKIAVRDMSDRELRAVFEHLDLDGSGKVRKTLSWPRSWANFSL
jgi:hypothetical protein